jgi:hypothetical protein
MHGSLETGSPARARSGRLRAGLLLALLALVVFPAAVAHAQAGPPGLIYPGDPGSSPGCSSAWGDWHDDTVAGTVGIHGQISWCWGYYGVTWVSWNQSPYTTRWYSVTAWYGPMGSPSWCAGGSSADFQANYQLTAPFMGVAGNTYARVRYTVCMGGVYSWEKL